ncbi:MAG: glucose-1-phosphate cytidylyltransferase [Bdellovibrionaceae bacterium]|nr:glucose-1-phosphate cytidylyltransferase [Pseudobdellovibrionaceae bacterium]
MKVAILAGGYGTRISEESVLKPKPMVEIGDKPILWHIMKYYSSFGFNEFIVLLGYKGYLVKEYFANYYLHQCDITIDTINNKMQIHSNESEDWKVTLVDTGLETMTGGRLLRAKRFLDQEPFMLTYGDGLANVDLNELVSFHKAHGKTMTLTAVQPEGRFGSLVLSNTKAVESFMEKPAGDGGWINGGFFVCEPHLFEYLKEKDKTILERKPLEELAHKGELYSYCHKGFWQCMDTLRDKERLNLLLESGDAPWKIWS